MWRFFVFFAKRQNNVSTSDEELDSDFENAEGGEEGPTLVTIDDGKVGIKCIKVIQNLTKKTSFRKKVCLS